MKRQFPATLVTFISLAFAGCNAGPHSGALPNGGAQQSATQRSSSLHSMPSRAAKASAKVLYKFKKASKGLAPSGPLVMDSNGNLYGTTAYGGTSNLGTVFELQPNGKG